MIKNHSQRKTFYSDYYWLPVVWARRTYRSVVDYVKKFHKKNALASH